MNGLISVIVTTYNRPDALDLVLDGLRRQSDHRFEVLVADDGSGLETAGLVTDWRGRAGYPLIHVWHEDDGFRAAEIRNRAILASHGDYLIFLDGDCVPRPSFVARHRYLAEPKRFVAGNRILLSEAFTDSVTRGDIALDKIGPLGWLTHAWAGDVNQLKPLLHLPIGPFRNVHPMAWWHCRTCNMAVWRADLDRIDGFDSAFVGWGYEDSELVLRLMRLGVLRKDGRFATGVFHLWHPLEQRGAIDHNETMFKQSQAAGRIRASRGLSALRQEGATS